MSATNRVEAGGLATVQATAQGPRLVLENGDSWQWDTTLVPQPVAPPGAMEGDQVWITSSTESVRPCPFCFTYYNRTMEIRDREDGQIQWLGIEGPVLKDVSPELQDTLFPTRAPTILACQLNVADDCWAAKRSVFDHVLPTSPPQTVRHATLSTITTAGGVYQVFWAYSEDDEGVKSCLDGPALAHDTGFAASRVRR